MKRKRLLKAWISALLITCLATSTVVSAEDLTEFQPGGTNTSYTHGSDVTVSESDLTTEIPSDYVINSETQAKASSGTYSKLFDTENLEEFHIDIDENNWNYMLQNASDKPYVLADSVSVGDESLSYVGIKTKGNLTLSQVYQSDSDRFSFTINTSKYVNKNTGYSAKQNFYGLEKFSLNNIYGDASYMKEYLSYELMSEMGLATPYYCLVKVYVNDEYWGVYCMVENVSSSLIKRTVDSSADGSVYKNESPGGDLLYNTDLDAYLSGDSTYDFSTYSDASNVLSNYTGILDNKETGTTIDDYLEDLADAETDEEKAAVEEEYSETLTSDCNELFTWMKTLNELSETEDANTDEYQEALESILDVDQVLRYFAVNTYLVNLDSYQSEKEQNYCIYLVNGSATIIPWDYNYSFGGYGVDDASEMINFNIDTPVTNTTLAERPLLNVILQNDEYRAIYESYLSDCTKIATYGGDVTVTNYNDVTTTVTYAENNFATQLTNYKENILSEALQETSIESPFYTYDQFTTAVDNLCLLINQRSLAVVNQINDDFTTVDTNGADLNAIGNVTGGSGGGGEMPGGDAPGEMPSDMPSGEAPSDMPSGGMPSDMPMPSGDTSATDNPQTSDAPAVTEPTSSETPEVTEPASSETPTVSETPTTSVTPTASSSTSSTEPVTSEDTTVSETPATDETTEESTEELVTKLTLSKSSSTLTVGKTVQLKATVTPTDATNQTVKWTSSDSSVAKVSKTGLVTALMPGTAVITCATTDGSNLTKTCKITVSKLGQVTNLSVSTTSTTAVKLTWTKVTGATGYQIYRYNSSTKKYVLVGATTSNSYVNKSLSSGTSYVYKVRAVRTVSGSSAYGTKSSALKATTKLTTSKLTVKKTTSSTTSLTVKKVTNATGYEIYRATSANGTYTKVKTVTSATTVTLSGLKSSKTYYYKVRAYKVVNGKKVYSSYSSVVKASTK